MAKKILNYLVKIIAVILAFTLLTLLFMPKYITKNADGRITSEYYREKTPIDVVFTGSSTVHAGISPMALYREYGITAYDRSNSSQVMSLSYYLAEESIKRNKPELIVADVGFIYQAIDYVDEGSSRKSLDGMKWSKSKSDCIKAMMDETESYIDYVFPILRFHSRWNDLSFEDLKYWLYKPTVTCNGQLLQFGTEGGDNEYNPYMLEEGTVACDENIAYLKRFIQVCQDNDVQVLLIKMPMIAGNWSYSLDEQISSLAEEMGVNYKNFIPDFDAIGFDVYSDFTDGQHMNSIGAEKFTKTLGQYIIENYDVSNRKDDIKCKAVFDKKLERYSYLLSNCIPAEETANN